MRSAAAFLAPAREICKTAEPVREDIASTILDLDSDVRRAMSVIEVRPDFACHPISSASQETLAGYAPVTVEQARQLLLRD
jgi:hypothetical protein